MGLVVGEFLLFYPLSVRSGTNEIPIKGLHGILHQMAYQFKPHYEGASFPLRSWQTSYIFFVYLLYFLRLLAIFPSSTCSFLRLFPIFPSSTCSTLVSFFCQTFSVWQHGFSSRVPSMLPSISESFM